MIGILFAALIHPPLNPGCGPGNFYDPAHSICTNYAPSAPEQGYPGYGGSSACGGTMNYDAAHGVCTPGQASSPPPFYGGDYSGGGN